MKREVFSDPYTKATASAKMVLITNNFSFCFEYFCHYFKRMIRPTSGKETSTGQLGLYCSVRKLLISPTMQNTVGLSKILENVPTSEWPLAVLCDKSGNGRRPLSTIVGQSFSLYLT